MATFIGTEDEFNTFIGPRMRNKIPPLTRAAKAAANNICQHCGRKVAELDAAHVHGRERKEIIHSVLEKYRAGDSYSVNLQTFEREFVNAHYPIEETFLFLCKDCHNDYDAPVRRVSRTAMESGNATQIKPILLSDTRESFPVNSINSIDTLENSSSCENHQNHSRQRQSKVDDAVAPIRFKDFLLSVASSRTGRKYSPNTVNGYIWGIGIVCEEENCKWEDLASRIDNLVLRYGSSGDKSDVGEKGKRTVISALKAYQRFVSTSE